MTTYEEYRARVKIDRKITKEMVDAGELTPEEGEFRDWFREDEIFEEMEW